MKNININWLYILILVPFLFSCEDYLELKSSNRFAVPETVQDLQALLDDQNTMNNRVSPAISQLFGDDYLLPEVRQLAIDDEMRKMYAWQPFEVNYPNDWSSSAKPIYNANYCLDMLKKIEVTPDIKDARNHVYGSALFFRSYYFLQLLWGYGRAYEGEVSKGVAGIVMREDADFNTPSRVVSVFDGYHKIINDLTESANYLPAMSQLPTRPSKLTVYSLLARTFLSMRMYDEALSSVEKALSLYDALIDFNNPDDGIKIGNQVPFQKFTKETIFYSSVADNYRMSIHLPNFGGIVHPQLIQLYEEDDLRLQTFFAKVEGGYRFVGNLSYTPTHLFSGIATSELFLIKAECLARSGKNEEALSVLNTFLLHRYVKGTNQLPKQLGHLEGEILSLILEERRKELLYRGVRWIDIKRYNLEGEDIVLERDVLGEKYKLNPNSPSFVVSLPRDLRGYF